MSQSSSNKGKELPGKKYNSINLNQTYKPKVEKTGSGVQGVRHGMQSLGKIGQSRRVLQPASLPSLKKENSGNDPRVNLVPPTGSQGWVKKDGQSIMDGAPIGVLDTTKATIAKNPTNNQEISLRPHAGVVPGPRLIPGVMGDETQKPSWVSKVQPQPSQGATKYFQREFPTLGGDSEKDIAVGSHAENLEQDANHLVMAHQALFSNGQKWMEGANGAMMVPANFPQFKGDPSQMFAGQQQCYPFPMPMYPGDMHNYPLHPMYMSYATGPSGKIPMNLYRMPKPVSSVNPQTDQTFVNKDSDDNGWAGAQEEVDYNAKLKFDESDDSDEDVSKKKKENLQKMDNDDSKKEKSIKSPPEGWSENQNFPAHVHMQAAYNHQQWSRMPYGFDPRTQVPYFFYPRYPYPVVMPTPSSTPSEQSDKNTESISKEAEPLTETPIMKPDDIREADRRAAAQAKLRKIEEDIKKREAEKKHIEVDTKKVLSNETDDIANDVMHKRSDSETSDSARHTRDIPPRFQRQLSAQKAVSIINPDGNTNDTISDSHFRIMKRKESYKSDDESCKENVVKKIESLEIIDSDNLLHEEKTKQTVVSSIHEVSKADQRFEVTDKSQKVSSNLVSSTSVSSTVYKDVIQKNHEKEKRGLKELTDFKAEIKNQDQKKSESALDKNSDVRFDSERFADLKLTKGHVKKKTGKEKGDVLPATDLSEREPTRASAWNKVVSQEASQSSGVKKTLLEIQKEEEELSKKAVEAKLIVKSDVENSKEQERSSPTENKFRSDTYQNKPFTKSDHKYQNDRRNKFDDDSKRRPNRYDREYKKTDFGSQNENYRDHPRERYRNRSENAHKDSLPEESLKESSTKEYDTRHEGKRDYSRYNGRDSIKKDYEGAKKDRGEYDSYKRDRVGDQDRYKKERADGEQDRFKKERVEEDQDKYKKDRVEEDQDKYKNERVDGEQDKYKKDRVEGGQDRFKKDRGNGEQDRYKKDRVEGAQDRYKKDRGENDLDRYKKDRGDIVHDKYKKDRGVVDYDRYKVREDSEYNKYKKDGTEKDNDRYKKDRGDIENSRYKNNKGDIDYSRVKKERGEDETRYKKGDYDSYIKEKVEREYKRPKTDKVDFDYNTKYKKDRDYEKFKKDRAENKRDGRFDKYSEKLQPKSTSMELQSDSVEINQEILSEKSIDKTNEADSTKLITKKDVEYSETSRRARDFTNRNRDIRKEYSSDYQKQEKQGSRRYERKDFDKDLNKKYLVKSSLEDDKTSGKDATVLKDVKSDNIEDGVLSKQEDVKSLSGPKDSVVTSSAPGKEVDNNISVPQKLSSKYNKSKTDYSSHNYIDPKEDVREAGQWRSRQSYSQDSFTYSKKGTSEKVKVSQEDEEFIGEDESNLKTKKITKKNHQKSWEQDRPPRFQQKYENEDRDATRWRGARGSHRGRSRGRGRGTSNNWSSNTELKVNQEKVVKDISQDAQEVSVSNSVEVANSETVVEQRRPQSNRDRGYGRDKGRGRGSYKGNGSNSTNGPRLDKSDSFLVNRQQLGNTLTSSNLANPQTAADKIDSRQLSENHLTKKNVSTLEDISTNSPSKRIKPVEKKRDIRKEFDLSNIASVVCIDDMKCFDSISQKSTDDDGFVKVISKKHQKKLRDKCREEEKQKFLLEQKKEASKAQKLARKEKVITLKKASTQVVETPTTTKEQLPIPTIVQSVPTNTVAPIIQPVTSNLHDMMGVWEPAQSLMRTSQNNPLSDQVSSSVSVSSNAWQRPLTLTPSSLPDPRAVGTGKPSSAPGVKVTVMHSQATPEAASPIITPPPLAPLLSSNGVSIISDLNNSSTNIKKEFSKSKSFEGKQQSRQNKHETQEICDDKKVKSNQKKEPKILSKKFLTERPPRFQANARRENEDRSRKFSEPRREKYSGKRDDKSRLIDRSQKGERFSREIKSKKNIELSVTNNNDEVFLNENISVEMQTKSLLSEEEKVVGSKKPSIKTQSSVSSYKSTDIFDEPANNSNISSQFQTSQDNILKSLCKEPENIGNKTQQSAVKSISGDDDRLLETRSLPGSPSLAVKIPEPTLCGPSSDPGKAPDPSIKKFASSIAQEMNEMNRKLLDAKKAWDETPTAWSDSASKVKTISVVSSSSVAENIPVLTECLPTTKFEQLSTVSISEVKSTEEKTVQNFSSKRTEQQNICKVKPQQQIPSEDNRPYIPANIPQVSNLSSQPNRGRYVLSMERPVQANIYESIYGDQLRAQGNQLAYSRPGQVHSIDQVVPPMSQRPEMVLSSLPVANPNTHFYGMDASIQNSQNALLTWQMVSTTNVQQTKPLHYQTQHHQGSLFTSPVISTSPLVMSYRSGYSPQRSTSSIQHQALMQHNQTAVMSPQEVGLNISDPYVGRLVGVLQPQPAQTRRDQQFQGVLPSQPLISTNAMTLLLDPSNPQNHLSQQQRSDLMKHVHAKPFEPTSQTPPLMQSPSLLSRHHSAAPIQQQHHSAAPIQQQVISSVFSQPTPHQQTQQKYSQPIIQRQPNLHQVNPLVAPVRPRAIHGQSSGTSPPLRTLSSHQEQAMNNHQNFVYQNALGLGHPRGSVMQSVHVTPHPMNNQYLGNYLQQQYQPTIQSRPTFNLPQNKPPGPIQRPLQLSPSNFSTTKQCSSNEEFKKIQRQKMLEDTKKYFQNDGSTPSMNTSAGLTNEDSSSTSQTNLSEHDKLTTDKPKDKRFDIKKSGRGGEQTRGNRNQRPKSNLSTNSLPLGKPYDLAQSKRSTSKV